MIERGAGRRVHPLETLAQTGARELERAMVAIGVVAGLAKEAMRRPGAAAHALGGVVASPAVPPQIVDAAVARVTQGLTALPDIPYRAVEHVAAAPSAGVQ